MPKTPPPLPPAVPIARPVTVNEVPLAKPLDASSSELDFNSLNELVLPRRQRQSGQRGIRRLISWIFFALLGGLGLALLAWGGIWVVHFLRTEPDGQVTERMTRGYNARFNWPSKPWQDDKDIQARFHVHIGMTSPEHNSGLALLFKDYKDRSPGEAELLDEALVKLRAYFQGLEWQLKPKNDEARLAGQSAQILEFQGVNSEEVTMNGECYAMTFRGYGYWFFTWAPLGELEQDREPIHAEWLNLRQRLNLFDGRKGWTERPRETEKVAGKKASYQLAYAKDLWTREPAEDYDPQADLVLKGHEPVPDRKPLAGKDATLQVLVLPKQANLKSAVESARSYLTQREKKLYEQTTLEPIKDKNGAEFERVADIGTEHGHLAKLHMKNTPELERFLLIAVVNRPEGVVTIVGDCLWERRTFWDLELMTLLKTFKIQGR